MHGSLEKMSGEFPKLYAIVDRATLDARGVNVGEFARELREGGVRLVQYRDKANGPQEVLRAAREIDAAFEGAEVMRVMNDRVDLAVLAGWDGVHVGQGDLPVEAARSVIGHGLIGLSTHNQEQVRVALVRRPDYVAVGPVFRTASKANPDPVVGLELVRRARAMSEVPIVAIGGITLGNARSVIEAGADSVAVIGGLFVQGRRMSEVVRDFLEVLG
jgi:thiamine-phosphate pyrophosphorylase